jgi:precorrin-6A/cobalt-precorrin-6A reductase
MAQSSPLRVLILGGTTEASLLARLLLDKPGVSPVLSLAGRTRNPVLPPIPHRIGGFGGVAGLVRYLTEEGVELLVDATHPFAARITPNAAEAARLTGVPLLRLERPGWVPGPGDDWRMVPDMRAAARALGAAPRRIFLTIGRQDLIPFRDEAPQHEYLVRSVDAPEASFLPARTSILTARGPFDVAAERALLMDARIDMLVTKNSGGSDAKLIAARACVLPVIMVDRPSVLNGARTETAEAALAWILDHGTLTARGA